MHIGLDTKFALLSEPQRRAVLAWANSHDWGGGKAVWVSRGTLRTACACFTAKDEADIELAVHDTLRSLRDWAGY